MSTLFNIGLIVAIILAVYLSVLISGIIILDRLQSRAVRKWALAETERMKAEMALDPKWNRQLRQKRACTEINITPEKTS